MKELSLKIKLLLLVLFLICFLDMPYGYFQLVRFLGMIGFGYLAFKEYEVNNNNMMIFYACSSVLINPICKITLGREIWNIVDFIWIIVIIGTLITKKNLR